MSKYRAHGPHRGKPANQQLRDNPQLPFLMAADLLLVQNQEANRNLDRRSDPADRREILEDLRGESQAITTAKIQYLRELRLMEIRLAEFWAMSPDPAFHSLGACLQLQNYVRMAR